jgi:type I restriction enzyme S subunit
MSELKNAPIRNFTLGIYDGPHATPKEVDEGPVFLGIKNVTPEGRLDLSEIRHVSEQEYPKWTKRVTPQEDDVVFSYEATLHRYALIPEGFHGCLGRRMALVRPDQSKIIPRFLHYYFMSPAWRAVVEENIINGATVDRIPIKKFPDFKVSIPLISRQRSISDVLSAYDDLIENNRRRIQLLEQAARLLYKEWFVHLRFPGHEHTKILDGVPEVWEKVTISSFCTVGRGGSPRPIKDFLGGTVPWFKIGDATASGSPFVFTTAEAIIEAGVKKSVLLQPNELILSNSATCGIPYFTGTTGCIHDGWLYFKDLRRVSKWFLYCCLHEKQRAILAGIGEGATQKNLNTDYIGKQSVVLSKSPSLINHFDSIGKPLFDQIFTLAQSNRKLGQARDLLLPKLMSGEVAV